MTSASGVPAPELVERFALFRDEVDECSAELRRAMEEYAGRVMSAMGTRFGLVRGRAASVRVTEDTTVVLIPGATGVAIIILGQHADGRPDRWASAAPLQTVLAGRPICDAGRPGAGRVYYGLAPDGTTQQAVTLKDGSTQNAAVRHNVFVLSAPQ